MKLRREKVLNTNLKSTNLEKYKKERKKATDYMREWRKKHPERSKEWARKHYQKIKKDPIKLAKLKKQIADCQKKRWETDPVFRKKMLEYNKQYRKRLKENDPEKYRMIFCDYASRMQPFVRGLKCKCGKNIITSVAGKSKRMIQCPECRKYWHKHELKKVKIPRNIPEMKEGT
jgi:hypothetical protein